MTAPRSSPPSGRPGGRPPRAGARPGRPPSARPPRVGDTPATGQILDLEIGSVAHGGHCVARHDGRVVFVRHTLPGERVRARVTDTGSRFWRADAVEILDPAPDRVPSVWPAAGPGGVGGGELAHVALAAQRRWKADVVTDQLRRIARYDGDLLDGFTVEPAGGDDAAGGLGYRTRIDLVAGDDGRLGMHRFRSHDVVALDPLPAGMPLATDAVAALAAAEDVLGRTWRPGTRIELVAPAVFTADDGDRAGGRRGGHHATDGGPPAGAAVWREGRGGPGGAGHGEPIVLVDGEPWHRGRADTRANARRSVRESVAVRLPGAAEPVTFTYRVSAAGFWQVHRAAPGILAQAVLDAAGDVTGRVVLDLYSGAGLFTLPLAAAVGERGSVVSVEGSAAAVRDARRNAHELGHVRLHTGDVAATLAGGDVPARADVVVLDPPRAGAKRDVVAAIADRGPERVVYVACDPAALARDVGYLGQAGYRLTALRAFDLFPHTHHVEAVAVLERA